MLVGADADAQLRAIILLAERLSSRFLLLRFFAVSFVTAGSHLSKFLLMSLSVELLCDDLRHDSCADSLASFADGEALLVFESDRSDELDLEGNRVARHDHFHFFRESHFAGDVRGADVELRLVASEERRVAAAFFFLQDVDFCLEFGVRLDGARLGKNLTAVTRLPCLVPRRRTPALSPAMTFLELTC